MHVCLFKLPLFLKLLQSNLQTYKKRRPPLSVCLSERKLYFHALVYYSEKRFLWNTIGFIEQQHEAALLTIGALNIHPSEEPNELLFRVRLLCVLLCFSNPSSNLFFFGLDFIASVPAGGMCPLRGDSAAESQGQRSGTFSAPSSESTHKQTHGHTHTRSITTQALTKLIPFISVSLSHDLTTPASVWFLRLLKVLRGNRLTPRVASFHRGGF